MNRIALFGGAFNPIGIHHIKITQIVWEKLQLKTFVMPCWSHRFAKELASAEHRWNMTCLAQEEYAIPFDFEYRNKHNGSMFETIEKLKYSNPDTEFVIVVGMDNANVIDKWDRGFLLIKENPFIVIKREGCEPTTDWFLKEPHNLLEISCGDLSSTEIRKAIYEDDWVFAEKNLNPRVWKYIKTNKLYGYQ